MYYINIKSTKVNDTYSQPVKSHILMNILITTIFWSLSFFLSFLNCLIFENIFSTIKHHCSNRQQTTILNKAESFFSIVFVSSLFLVYRTTGTHEKGMVTVFWVFMRTNFFQLKNHQFGRAASALW